MLSLVDLLEDAGLNATADARDLDLPGALVTPERVVADRLGDDYTITWHVYLLAADNGPVAALDDLGDMFDLAKDRLGVGEAQPVTLTLPNLAADPLPALLLTFDTNVTDESS